MMKFPTMKLSSESAALKMLCDSMAEEVASSIGEMIGDPACGEVIDIGADGTPTKGIDKIAETAALAPLKDFGQGFKVLSEELGEVQIGEKPEYFLHLDPLDGTFNAINGIPFYSISIYISNLNCSFAYVFDLVKEIRYYAEYGNGAYMEKDLDRREIRVSSLESIENFSIAAYTIRPNTHRINRLGDIVRRIRSMGCTSLEMCLVASGKLDAFVDLRGNIRVVDFAAGKLIVEEAGGQVTDGRGRAIILGGDMWQSHYLLASSGMAHDRLLELLGGDGN
jgi:myo-inositol-1(or 4)-monophosphatase